MKLRGKEIPSGKDGHPFTNLFWRMIWNAPRFGRSQPYMAEAFYEIGNMLDDPEQARETNWIVDDVVQTDRIHIHYMMGVHPDD